MGDQGVSPASSIRLFSLLIVYSGDKDLEVGIFHSWKFTTKHELLT